MPDCDQLCHLPSWFLLYSFGFGYTVPCASRSGGPSAPCQRLTLEAWLQVVYEWARGTPFEEICELTDVMEGSIVRTIVRLDEVCREFRDAARVMGNTQLFQQMEQASAAIKRDVIFAASLYVA